MTIATKIIFIAALILSIIIPFGYYLIGEKNKKRYKRTIGINAFFFFGAFAIASIAMLAGPDSVHAATAAANGATLATGMGYLAAALVTGLSCIGGGIAVASAASAALGGSVSTQCWLNISDSVFTAPMNFSLSLHRNWAEGRIFTILLTTGFTVRWYFCHMRSLFFPWKCGFRSWES